ncbi:ribonuclease P protein component [Tepidimonas taiwanensis]|uniref:ribonuclease P protein component n=1 Tax=Tepidimonas taiwanensis TaxID=307486 RepID=UPI000A753DFC|nr:ribonuclease P protein component [Tepidimonas taiwanensis]UBQ05560.1 ribonuclease P protein component [Tepidimonas taiwanensis]
MSGSSVATPLRATPAHPTRRLRQRAQFQAVLSSPALAHTAHFALHGVATAPWRGRRGAPLFPGEGAWLGAVLPKRWARRAVTRSTLKRQIYAVEREHPLPPGAWVVRLKRAFAPSEFPSATSVALRRAVRAELQQLLGPRLRQRLAAAPLSPAPAPPPAPEPATP